MDNSTTPDPEVHVNARYRLLSLFAIILLAAGGPSAEGQLFQQTFSTPFGPLQGTSATPVFLIDANYVSAAPTSSQFTHICATGSSGTSGVTVSGDGATLTMDRVSAGNGAATRNFAFPG